MGLYIGAEYFQIIHYYYFCMGIFSFTAAIMFGFPYSIFFIIFCIIHSAISWYVAYFMEERMRKFVVIQSSGYMASHVLLTFLTAGLTLFLWYYQVFIERFLIDSIIQINYFVFFLGLLWYIMTRFGVVGNLFAYFDSLTLRRAKRLILNKRGELGLKKLITDIKIKSYEPGSEPEIDSILISVWRERESNIERNIYEFETKMCEKIVEKFRDRIEKIKSKPDLTLTDQKMIRSYERFIEDYERNDIEYEKFFIKKNY
ncbi:MAG: hypothetical protein JSW41_03130 [Candidatus Aenigmatarchaeota archaeon]|nr:MAG: hypothetical protein JSW41_03130 [Candidatus Aenigmarchaeota archaeon]